MYQALCSYNKFDTTKLTRVEPIDDCIKNGIVTLDSNDMQENTFFIYEKGGLPEGCTYWVTFVKTKDVIYAYHGQCIVEITGSVRNYDLECDEDAWRKLTLGIGFKNLKLSHYDYLNVMLNSFWYKVFGKTADDMWCGGIVTAHGDKGYQYKDDWENAGIPYNRGMMMFLLSYTKLLGNTPKYLSCEWVIENYPKYEAIFDECEKQVGLS